MNCKLCDKPIPEPNVYRKMFCNRGGCYDKFMSLKKCSEIVRLSDEDKVLYNKLKLKGFL